MREILQHPKRALCLAAIIVANLIVAGSMAREARAQGDSSCIDGTTCRCFGGSYCTDWPTGDTCKSSNDCD